MVEMWELSDQEYKVTMINTVRALMYKVERMWMSWGGSIWVISVPSFQFYYELKIAVKNKIIIKKIKQRD